MRGLFVVALCVTLGSGVQFVHATPGGVDANGCHRSQSLGFHCHPERAKSGGTTPGGESTAQREKRLKRECKGRPNAGACSGYAT